VERTPLRPSPGGSVARRSRHGEAGSVTNPPTGWDEGQGQKDQRMVASLLPLVARETEPRSPDEVFWWKLHALDSEDARDKSDSQRSGRHRAHAPSHHVLGVALGERALPLVDNAVCHRIGGESPLLQNFLFAQHGPSVEDQRMIRAWASS
jgi:hypothetical protein